MDSSEDLSPRVLLQNILTTGTPRTPVTRSASQRGTRSSERLSRKDAGGQTPKDILRRNLKHKMRESITRKSLPATKMRRATVTLRKLNTPTVTSHLFSEDDTPRNLLLNFMQSEPVQSPVVHDEPQPGESELPSATSSVTRSRPSIELSGLELPDVTIANAASTVKGLSRKRPRRSLNVTAFEKRLKDENDTEEAAQKSANEVSSPSLSSFASLSLKTPSDAVETEKRGLQRRVSQRRKITEEEFGAAVNKTQMEGVEQKLGETAYSEGITLGLSKLSEPNITADIVYCNTALYDQPDAMTSNFSLIPTQEKPTVIASQLQRKEEPEEHVETMTSQQQNARSVIQSEEDKPQKDRLGSEVQRQEDEDESGMEEGTMTARGHPESEKDAEEKRTEDEDAGDSQFEGDVEAGSQSEEEAAPLSQSEGEAQEEEGASDSHPEGFEAGSQFVKEESLSDSQTGKEEDSVVDSQSDEHFEEVSKSVNGGAALDEEEGVADFQPEEVVEAGSQSEEGEVALNTQTEEEEEDDAVQFQSPVDTEAGSQSEESRDALNTQTEEEEEEEDDAVKFQSPVDAEARPQSEESGDALNTQTEEEEDDHAVQFQSPVDTEAGSQSEESGDALNAQTEEEEEEDDAVQFQSPVDTEAGPQSEEGEVALNTQTEEEEEDDAVPFQSPVDAEAGPQSEESGDALNAQTEEEEEEEDDAVHFQSPVGTEAGPQSDEELESDEDNVSHLPEGNQVIEDGRSDASSEGDDQEQDLEDEEDEDSDGLPCKTPPFVRQKINFFHAEPVASQSVQARTSGTGESLPAAKPKQVRKRRRSAKKAGIFPKTYLMNTFKHFAKTKVAADVYPVLNDVMDKFFDRMVEDLETYAGHAKRKTIEVEDAVLLLKRQGYVNDKVPVEVLIEKYLRMNQRKLLIPIATSGNVVVPKPRK
ncbi:uncharacterized protein cenpt [Pholidichthys leucotaenia]